jgi:hypothetical protein
MAKMKYIVVQTTGENPEQIPFIFPKSVNHDAMYEGVRTAFISQDWIQSKILSAGFVDMSTLNPSGYSETLKLGPRKEDHDLLKSVYS